MRITVLVRGVVVLFITGLTFFLASKIMDSSENLNDVKYSQDSKVKKPVCGMETPCPADQFSFRIISGAANVVGPTICFNNKILMSGILNNIGKGLNIAVVNASSGNLLRSDFFDMWTGNVKLLLDFLNLVKPGNIVFLASFDDPATKMTDEARTLFSELGSSLVHNVQFRDNWVFVGAKPIKEKSPFEQSRHWLKPHHISPFQ
ncbi:protein FAM3C-like isoform X2 [Heterodontus francisci]|uniref:protein FAM3C-like isoform X2 n=1 Tax=Heterodontus francisci TaxID=7792 RepID=UPI00355B5543